MSFTKIDGIKTFYNIQGNGTPILFVHPPLLTSDIFAYQVKELCQRFKTIVFDIRGNGKSEESQRPLSYPLIASDILSLMDFLKIDRAVLCGYSTGGSVILEFLLNYPDRGLGAILIGGMSEAHGFRLKARICLGIGLSKMKAIKFLSSILALAHSNTMSFFQKLYNSAKHSCAKNVEQYYAYSLHYNCTNRLSEISCKTLLVYGEYDKTFHAYGRILQDRINHSELKFIRQTNHQIPIKTPYTLNRLISEFVQSLGQYE